MGPSVLKYLTEAASNYEAEMEILVSDFARVAVMLRDENFFQAVSN